MRRLSHTSLTPHPPFSQSDATLQKEADNHERFYLDSRISFFGVGGTQASFYFVKNVLVGSCVSNSYSCAEGLVRSVTWQSTPSLCTRDAAHSAVLC
jgi:hypothetical protein